MTDKRKKQAALSERLKAVADLVTPGSVVCDVGCDHGFVPIYLVQERISPRVIAMDVKPGPLRQARTHIAEYGLDTYIMTRLSDGVSELRPGEADVLLLAGMGGRLMLRILTRGRDKIRKMRELILQPQSDLEAVREWTRREGYPIVRENIIYEDGKYYPMLKAACAPDGREPDAEALGDWQRVYDRYGELLLKEQNPVLREFLLWEQDREEWICRQLSRGGQKPPQRSLDRAAELLERARLRRMALSLYEA